MPFSQLGRPQGFGTLSGLGHKSPKYGTHTHTHTHTRTVFI